MKAIARLSTNYITQIAIGEHTVTVDEPERLGGQNLGPAPTDLLLASLASCTAITLRMYFNRKSIEIGEVLVKCYYENDDENLPIHRSIEFNPALAAEWHDRVKHIANACPVHKIINRQNSVLTHFKL